MKITIYELLGMVKDDKAPKLVKYEDYIYSWDSDYQDYVCDDLFLLDFTSISEDLQEYLQCTLEILEEKKIPEKLNYKYKNMYGNISQHKQSEIDIIDTLNGVIDYLKSKGE